MYIVTALRAVQRVKTSRTGVRLRRNPVVVMKDGSTIKLSPGRSVRITEEIYHWNKKLFEENSTVLRVTKVGGTEEVKQESAPAVEVKTPVDPPAALNEDIVENTKAVEPAVEPTEEIKPKKRTRRKKSADTEVTEEASKRRRRRKSTSNEDAV